MICVRSVAIIRCTGSFRRSVRESMSHCTDVLSTKFGMHTMTLCHVKLLTATSAAGIRTVTPGRKSRWEPCRTIRISWPDPSDMFMSDNRAPGSMSRRLLLAVLGTTLLVVVCHAHDAMPASMQVRCGNMLIPVLLITCSAPSVLTYHVCCAPASAAASRQAVRGC